MATTVIVQQQSNVAYQTNEWSTGIFDCCDDMSVCCCAFWCFGCFTSRTVRQFGECCCLSRFDDATCVPPISLSIRVAVRYRYGIQGSICEDCIYVSFFNVCSWCQISREIKRHKKNPTIITTQPGVTTSQPGVTTSQPGAQLSKPLM